MTDRRDKPLQIKNAIEVKDLKKLLDSCKKIESTLISNKISIARAYVIGYNDCWYKIKSKLLLRELRGIIAGKAGEGKEAKS